MEFRGGVDIGQCARQISPTQKKPTRQMTDRSSLCSGREFAGLAELGPAIQYR